MTTRRFPPTRVLLRDGHHLQSVLEPAALCSLTVAARRLRLRNKQAAHYLEALALGKVAYLLRH